MGRSAKRSVDYDWLRPLVAKARDELGLTGALQEAGIEGRNLYKAVHRWLEGEKNRKGNRPLRALPHDVGMLLRRHLSRKYPTEFKQAWEEEQARWQSELEIAAELWKLDMEHEEQQQRLEERLRELKEKGRG